MSTGVINLLNYYYVSIDNGIDNAWLTAVCIPVECSLLSTRLSNGQ
jgi:hypothetical protein